MIDILQYALVGIAALLFFSRRSLRYLQYFQQEEYNGARFLAWYRRYRAFDTRVTPALLVALGLGLLLPAGYARAAAFVAALALALLALFEGDPRKAGKLPLKLTARAKRIWMLAQALSAVLLIAALALCARFDATFTACALYLIVHLQAVPLFLVLANRLLAPHERRLQQGFIDEARAILRRADPVVIGITGSYGKTSTKAILGTFLQSVGPTFWPPKSINTPMGIVREIRERLTPGFRFAVIEMGAYGIGSIKRLCDLTPPKAALITNIGIMHLERFGSRDAVYQAKSELARALPADGILICNADDPGSRRVADEFPAATTRLYGIEATTADFRMTDVEVSPSGSRFRIHWNGQVYEGATGLLGRPQLSNLLGAFATACVLGANPAALLALAAKLTPQPHRMALRRDGDVLTIDDSYNSNPVGFAAALEVLGAMPGTRKLLVTPGMIELGELQATENRRIAALAATVCDRIVVVGDTNYHALLDGLKDGGAGDDNIIPVPHRDQAIAYLAANAGAGDVVLWENDLPDVYESTPRF